MNPYFLNSTSGVGTCDRVHLICAASETSMILSEYSEGGSRRRHGAFIISLGKQERSMNDLEDEVFFADCDSELTL